MDGFRHASTTLYPSAAPDSYSAGVNVSKVPLSLFTNTFTVWANGWIAVEKGGAGATLAPLAAEIVDYYFRFKSSTNALEAEMTTLK